MRDVVKKIENDAINEIIKIVQFRAFTSYGYHFLESKISSGEKILLILADPRFDLEVRNETQLLDNIKRYKVTYLTDLSFIHCVSVFEWFVFDLLKALLKDKPERIGGKKQCELSVIFGSNDKDEVIDKVIDREINNVKYSSVKDWFEYINNIIRIDFPGEEDLLKLAEIKASRDIIIHNNYIVNKIYIQKSGKHHRYDVGDRLSVSDKEYFNDSAAFLKKMVEGISNKILDKYSAI